MEFKKYPKIKRFGHDDTNQLYGVECIVQEKIDGGNFRFAKINGELVFGTRTTTIDDSSPERTEKMFRGCVEYVKETIKDNLDKIPDGFIFFGENCVKHTIVYDFENMPRFLGFDIMNLETGLFLPFEKTEQVFKELGLEMAPYLGKVTVKTYDESVLKELVPISKYALDSAQDRKAEGIMLKNYDKQIFAKYVRDEFKERNAAVFGGSPKYNKIDDTDNAEFIFKYVTNPRIEKLIMKKMSMGEELSMKMMGSLIRDTYLDIIEEEWKEILTSNWKLDFKSIRKRIAPRVRGVLDQFIAVNNSK